MNKLSCPGCGYEFEEYPQHCPNCHFPVIAYKHRPSIPEEIYPTIGYSDEQRCRLLKNAMDRPFVISDEELKSMDSIAKPSLGNRLWAIAFALAGVIDLMFLIRISEFSIHGIVLIVIAVICALISWTFESEYQKAVDLYTISKKDLRKARYMKAESQNIAELQSEILRYNTMFEKQRQQEREESKCYICPQCGARAGKPLTMVNKSVSIGVKGLASNKIGKSYQCSKCKYIW